MQTKFYLKKDICEKTQITIDAVQNIPDPSLDGEIQMNF